MKLIEEKIDILMVDDRPENLLALATVLNSPSYHLIKVSSGTEALRYLLKHEPAVILMDVQMPGLDGFQTTTLIKSSERTRDIPIIFITAINQDEHYIHQGYKTGAVDYLYKPYDPFILASKVAIFAELARKSKRLLQMEKQLRETERKEREQELVHLELKSLRREKVEQKKYLDLVEGINHGIVWSADADSLAISFVSPSAERLLGYPLDQWSVEQHFIIEHTHPDDLKKLLTAVQAAKTENKPVEIEHRFISRDQREIWFQTGLRIAERADHMGQDVRGLSVEITKIKEAEEFLKSNKKHSDFLALASAELSKSLDFEKTLPSLSKLAVPEIADWFFLQINDEDKTMNSVSIQEQSSNALQIAPTIFQNYELTENSESLLIQKIDQNYLKTVTKNKDQLIALQALGLTSAILVPLRSQGKCFGVLSVGTAQSGIQYRESDLNIIEDLARRLTMAFDNAKFYRQAQTAIQVRDEFLSVASHELKTPLTPLKLQIQMLTRILKAGTLSQISPEKLEKILNTSDRQLERLALLVDELLDIARINNGKLKMEFTSFDIIELMTDILDRFNEQFKSSRCEVYLDFPKQLEVKWDRFRIEQVMINLLTNAMKYAPGKPIFISLKPHKNDVKIVVRDEGIGIAKKDQDRIFARFERAVSSNHFSGLGLGLYIVTQVIEAHGGAIDVESDLGKGAQFSILLPVRVNDMEGEPHAREVKNEI